MPTIRTLWTMGNLPYNGPWGADWRGAGVLREATTADVGQRQAVRDVIVLGIGHCHQIIAAVALRHGDAHRCKQRQEGGEGTQSFHGARSLRPKCPNYSGSRRTF